MKRVLLFIALMQLPFVCFGQVRAKTIISPYVDTTFDGFSEIYNLWVNYLDELNQVSAKNSYIIDQFPSSLLNYWDQSEIDSYPFPDLYYAFKRGSGNVFYPMEKQYFLGIVKRSEDLFELRTMFVAYPEELFRGIPSYIITVPVKKVGNTYKLSNEFTHRKSKLVKQEIGLVRYYYNHEYKFNEEKAHKMQGEIQSFKEGFGLNFIDTIQYIITENLTQAGELFGVQHYDTDFLSGLSTVEAKALKTNNMVLSGAAGEDHFHEIIHLLLSELKVRGSYHWYEEGIATYFGGSLMQDFEYHVRRLKLYLSDNPWIDLSGSLSAYYHDDEGNLHFGYPPAVYSDRLQFYKDQEMKSNFTYAIHAVICDIAFKMGGYETVKELFLCEANNEGEFYKCIEDVLSIKKDDLNEYFRSFINSQY